MMSLLQRQLLRVSLTALLFVSTTTRIVNAETVQLAKCPEEPDVVGHFYNNGETCVRDRVSLDRIIQQVDCPDDYTYQSGWCRKSYKRKIKPSCSGPTKDYQMFLGNKGECHSPCPPNYSKSYGQCTLRRASLSPKFMYCPDDDDELDSIRDNNNDYVQHRYGAYCCSQELGNCPRPECKVGPGVPGKFYYDSGICKRQAESLPRVTMPRLKTRLGQSQSTNTNTNTNTQPKKPPACPTGKIPVRNACQEPCPDGYQTFRGKCELRSCTFDTKTDVVVTCAEGTYKLPQAIL